MVCSNQFSVISYPFSAIIPAPVSQHGTSFAGTRFTGLSSRGVVSEKQPSAGGGKLERRVTQSGAATSKLCWIRFVIWGAIFKKLLRFWFLGYKDMRHERGMLRGEGQTRLKLQISNPNSQKFGNGLIARFVSPTENKGGFHQGVVNVRDDMPVIPPSEALPGA